MAKMGNDQRDKEADDLTMAAIGFAPDDRGGYKKILPTPPRPGEAIRDMLKACGRADALIPVPSADDVYDFLRRHNLTGSQAARMMYLTDSRQVRKYTGGASPRQMDPARWFALHAHVMLTPEQIAEIEAAMEKDASRS